MGVAHCQAEVGSTVLAIWSSVKGQPAPLGPEGGRPQARTYLTAARHPLIRAPKPLDPYLGPTWNRFAAEAACSWRWSHCRAWETRHLPLGKRVGVLHTPYQKLGRSGST